MTRQKSNWLKTLSRYKHGPRIEILMMTSRIKQKVNASLTYPITALSQLGVESASMARNMMLMTLGRVEGGQ